ncbi:hypothetical protein ACHAWX_000293 [Stephanocyclus meneghinianus]
MFDSQSLTSPMSPQDDSASNEQIMDEVHHEYRRWSALDMPHTTSHHGKMHPHPHSNSEGHHQSWAETDWEELVKSWTREIMSTSADQLSSLSSEEFRENCDASLDDHRDTSDGKLREADLFLLSLRENWATAVKDGSILQASKEVQFENCKHADKNVNPFCHGQSKPLGRLQNRWSLARRRPTV